jgi:hypothetical protein
VPTSKRANPGFWELLELNKTAITATHVVHSYKNPETAMKDLQKRYNTMSKMSNSTSWDADGNGFTAILMTGKEHKLRIMTENPSKMLYRTML